MIALIALLALLHGQEYPGTSSADAAGEAAAAAARAAGCVAGDVGCDDGDVIAARDWADGVAEEQMRAVNQERLSIACKAMAAEAPLLAVVTTKVGSASDRRAGFDALDRLALAYRVACL